MCYAARYTQQLRILEDKFVV